MTSLGHSGLRVKQNGFTLVVDPGIVSAADSFEGADALLITHEHADHYDAAKIKAALAVRPRLPIYTNKSVAALLEGSDADVHVVGHGDAFEVGGIPVHVYGEWHAVAYRTLPRIRNIGFLIGHKLLHPGDALTDPCVPIDLLLVALEALWTKDGTTVDYIKQVKPKRAAPGHDGPLTDLLRAGKDSFLAEKGPPGPGTGVPYTRLPTQGFIEI